MATLKWQLPVAMCVLFGTSTLGRVSGFSPPTRLHICTREGGLTPVSAQQEAASTSATQEKIAKVGDLLSDLPTPSLLVELSLMQRFLDDMTVGCSVEEFLNNPHEMVPSILAAGTQQDGSSLCDCGGAVFIHTRVTSTKKRDAVVQQQGSGKSLSVCTVDTPPELVAPAGVFLGLGLANHHVGGYYWARSMGIGASLPAHGIYFGPSSDDNNTNEGELYWKKRGPGDPAETTEESSNSNDGKRSEWADFLKVGDTVQLVPNDPLSLLLCNKTSECFHGFGVLLGIRRAGRPLGSDPIVEKIWTKSTSGNYGAAGWTLQQ